MALIGKETTSTTMMMMVVVVVSDARQMNRFLSHIYDSHCISCIVRGSLSFFVDAIMVAAFSAQLGLVIEIALHRLERETRFDLIERGLVIGPLLNTQDVNKKRRGGNKAGHENNK